MSENLFEKIKKFNKEGLEFWSARELSKILHYEDFRNFENAIARAKISCKRADQDIKYHFVDATDMISIGTGTVRETERNISDYQLSRYACYLIAQNGDPRKVEVAKAQTYFAIKTRQREMDEQLMEDQKRVFLRGELKSKNKDLASTAKKSGVTNFANFQDFGYMGLYGGMRQKDIKKKKGLTEKDILLDNIGSEELVANLFRASQADAKIRRENIIGERDAGEAHKLVGQKVRNTIKTLGGTMPENLAKMENIKSSKKRLKSGSKSKLLK
jgi:DNA-damage-inducible protein D